MAEGTVTIRGRAELGEINRAVGKLERQVDKVDKTSKRAKVSIQDTGRALAAFGATAAVGGAALGALVDDTLKARLEIANLANTVGVTAPTFGALAKAAELAGKSSDQLVGGLSALGAAAYDAANRNEEAMRKFDALKVSVTDANGELRDTESIFRDVLAELGKIPNEAERTAVAQKLMGESAGALKAALGELSIEGFEAAQRKAHAFTRGLSEEGLEAAAKYEAALTKLDAVMRSFGDQVSGLAGPVLNGFVDGLVLASTFVSEVFTKSFERLGERVFLFVESLKRLGPVLDKVFKGDLRAAYQEAEKAGKAVTELRESMGLGLIPVVSDIGPILAEAAVAAETMRQRVNGVHDATSGASKGLKSYKKSIEDATEATEEFNEAAIVFKDSLDQIILEDRGDLDDFRDGWNTLTEAAIQYLHTARAMEDLPSVVTQKTLGDLEAFASGYTQVADIIGRVAGLYVDAARQSDNLTEKQKQAARTAFRVQQAAALATAVMNTALGVTQALASMPPPISFVQAALVAAAGGVSIAEIAGQKPPSFAVGGVMPSTGGPAILHPGEGVLSAGAVDSLGGVSALDALNGRSAMGGGGMVVVSWKHLRQSFAYEARDAANRPGPLRSIRRDGRRAGQMRRAVRADYGSL
jgi:hypothetical protein